MLANVRFRSRYPFGPLRHRFFRSQSRPSRDKPNEQKIQ